MKIKCKIKKNNKSNKLLLNSKKYKIKLFLKNNKGYKNRLIFNH